MRRSGLVVLFFLLTLKGMAQAPILILEATANDPVLLTNAGDGSHRRFIVEQVGRILVLQPGSTSPTLFMDIRSRIASGGERGLLGLAFHPRYSANRRFFVNYTRAGDGATVIAEFRASATNPNLGDPLSEIILLTIAQPFTNHNGGALEFGPDNLLYIATGDGGSANDPGNRAQNINDLLGKILRIDVDRQTSPNIPYASPRSNPFFGSIPGRDEIFAYGLRNPWRMSFDRFTGELYTGDVGQDDREEVDIITLGGNYGWRVFEGTRCTGLGPTSCTSLVAIPPVAEYQHAPTQRCSVTGGYVYRGTRGSLPYGAYIYGDYCTGEIFALQNGVQTLLLDTGQNISSFGEDESGELYLVGHGGSIFRMTGPGPSAVTERTFAAPPGGAFSLPSVGGTLGLTTGSARVQPGAGSTVPQGFAIFSLRKDGTMVSEASVPAGSPIASGRLPATTGAARTGVAIANPNPQAVSVEFYFTDRNGLEFGRSTTQVAANAQLAAFLNEPPFNGGANLDGTFTFIATQPVVAIAIQGRITTRGEFLMTTLPISPVPAAATSGPLMFPHSAEGGGWETDFVLVNTSDESIAGLISFSEVPGSVLLPLNYEISPRGSQRLRLSDTSGATRVRFARLFPTTGPAPSGIAIFRLTSAEGVISEAGVLAMPEAAVFRGYAEASGVVRTGLALANPSSSPVNVTVELTKMDGSTLPQAGALTLGAQSHYAAHLNEIPGLTNMPMPFQGMMRLVSSTPIGATSLRVRMNERGEFLIAASPPSEVVSGTPSSAPVFFPHFALGGGFDMQFVLFNTHATAAQSGTLSFSLFDGQPAALPVP